MLTTMDRRVFRVLAQVTLVALLAQSGSCIKCYTCTSKTEPKCADPAEESGLTTTECTQDILKAATSAVTNMFKNIDIGAANLDLQMACQKIDVTEASGEKLTIRGCSVAKSDTIDPCKVFEEANKMTSERKMSFCGQCESDACNSTNRLRPGAFLFSLLLTGLMAGFAAFSA